MRVSDIRAAAFDQLQISTVDPWTSEEQVDRWVLRAIRRLESEADWSWMECVDIAVFAPGVDQVAASAVVDGFERPARRVLGITYIDHALERRTFDEIREMQSNVGDRPRYFATYRAPGGEHWIVVAPRLPGAAGSIILETRLVAPSVLNSTFLSQAPELLIPEEFEDALTELVCYYGWRARGRMEDAGAALASYQRIVDAMRETRDLVLEDGSFGGTDRDRDSRSQAGLIGGER